MHGYRFTRGNYPWAPGGHGRQSRLDRSAGPSNEPPPKVTLSLLFHCPVAEALPFHGLRFHPGCLESGTRAHSNGGPEEAEITGMGEMREDEESEYEVAFLNRESSRTGK
jgi:hypothetical protein